MPVPVNGPTLIRQRQIQPLVLPIGSPDIICGPRTKAFLAGTDMNNSDVAYLSSSGVWLLADNTTLAAYQGLLGIVVDQNGSVSTNDITEVALPGSMIKAGSWSGMTIGNPIYLGSSGITQTQPSASNAAIRILGWAVSATAIFFYPSPDYITHI